MANATAKLVVAGFLATLPVSARISALAGSLPLAGTLEVCVNSGTRVPLEVLARAEAVSSRMFGTAGVALVWRCAENPAGQESGQPRVVRLDFSINTPPSDHPGALAYALPFQGVDIVVLFDRVRSSGGERPTQVSTLLAHVMTHEITHLLEGIARHSGTGVMKAHWDGRDLSQMGRNPLVFAPEDILLIQTGLRPHAARAASGHSF